MDAALLATNTPITEENYSRAGSALVELNQSNGASPMDVLECIPGMTAATGGTSMSFPDAAALCSVDLQMNG